MNLLNGDDEWKLWNSHGIDDMNQAQAIAFARDYAAAILAKLASAELPESHELVDMDGETNHVYYETDVRQAFKQGAASQIAGAPSAWSFKQSKVHNCLQFFCPPEGSYDNGTLVKLYKRKEPK